MDALKLKYYVGKNDMTLTQLAKALDITMPTLYRKMNGETDFYRHELQVISDTLGLNDSEFKEIFFK